MTGEDHAKHIAFLGSYLPRLCGIATFTHDLCEAVSSAAPDTDCFVAGVNDTPDGYDYPPRVRFALQETELDSYRRAAGYLNANHADLLCVQHEFGIYGGPAGSHLLTLLEEARMPVVTTLHTVLQEPTADQRRVMEELAARSQRLVVMTNKGAVILSDTYGVPRSKLDIIPHGIPDTGFVGSRLFKAQFGLERHQVLLTFGLLGPGKGIEHAIEALPEIIRRHPSVVYLILGATHPQLLATEGERYRRSLERLAKKLGVSAHTIFHNRFVSLDELKAFIGATDIYITPYLNEAQVTSGTLAYVFGAGKAVVSTPYWHAQELLAEGRGVLVRFRDPTAIAEGVCGLLDNPARVEAIRRGAYAVGRRMTWPSVARSYLETFQHARAQWKATLGISLAEGTLRNRRQALPIRRLDHLARMTDATGIFQHATFTVPNFHEGYCADDNARAFILWNLLDELGDLPTEDVRNGLATTYLAFLAAALNYGTGRFRNFMSHGRRWLEEAGSEDSHGRALWAAGTGAGHSREDGHRRLAAQLFDCGIPAIEGFTSPRAWAFALLGIHEYLRGHPDDPKIQAMRCTLTGRLVGLWHKCASADWPWFEACLTYENARLPQALILSGHSIPNAEALEIGLKSLAWLTSVQTAPSGHFRSIGSNGFYTRGGTRADHDQQPVEAQAMVSACRQAYGATGQAKWAEEAKRAFEWFLGRNDLGVPLYDSTNGGCSDGLHYDRISANQGAESTLAFHLALADMKRAEQLTPPPPRRLAATS